MADNPFSGAAHYSVLNPCITMSGHDDEINFKVAGRGDDLVVGATLVDHCPVHQAGIDTLLLDQKGRFSFSYLCLFRCSNLALISCN